MGNQALGNIQSRSLEVVGKSYEAKTLLPPLPF